MSFALALKQWSIARLILSLPPLHAKLREGVGRDDAALAPAPR